MKDVLCDNECIYCIYDFPQGTDQTDQYLHRYKHENSIEMYINTRNMPHPAHSATDPLGC